MNPDFWAALAQHDDALQIVLHLCNEVWRTQVLPTAWKHATVVTPFKKGNTALPENYRPISLLSVAYKVLASLILTRLRQSGVEQRLRSTQFGFRAKRSTAQAVFIAKRLIENAWALPLEKLSILLLDWSKAFDRISPPAMLHALRRFGIPEMFIAMISAIYSDRTFCIRDGGVTSSTRQQAMGIAQGCPLSPYLFIITLTVIFEDVDALTSNRPSSVLDVSYADDTLLSAAGPSKLQEYIDTLIGVAGRYGLKPNWKKTMHLRVHHSGDLFDSDRNPIRVTEQAVYLGSLLTTSGFAFPAVARRLGEARGAFEKIRAVWKHANIPRERKIQIYSACVLAKLLYSLESECFRKADISKIDAFHCRCLRVILGIPHSMISRVTNATVLETAGSKLLSTTVSSRQLILFGNIAALPDSSMITV